MINIKYGLVFLFYLVCFQTLLFFHSETFVLFLSFFALVGFVFFSTRLDFSFLSFDEEVSFLSDVDWQLLMVFFFRFKNWYRFFIRSIYQKIKKFLSFFVVVKEYFFRWLQSIFPLFRRKFSFLNERFVLERCLVLNKFKKASQYRVDPFSFLAL